jgi:Cytochrome c7 and related cytochrome c
MAQIFPRGANTFAKVSIVGGVFAILGLGFVADRVSRSTYVTGTTSPPHQTVPFSHKHHVAGLGLDCRYCHTTVETSSFAGIPPTETCFGCHKLIWVDAPILEPVRASFRDNVPLQWTRVHDLPQFVYFNHSIHINKGVGCATCHGRVDQMPLMWSVNSLQMEWCLGCHRDPAKYLRPKDQVFNMAYEPEEDQSVLGPRLMAEYNVKSKTDCWYCHR